MRLTPKQRTMLTHVARICDSKDFDGYAPHGAGEWRTIRALDRLGLVQFSCFGECGDGCERAGDCPHPVQIFTLSDNGRRAVDEFEAAMRQELERGK